MCELWILRLMETQTLDIGDYCAPFIVFATNDLHHRLPYPPIGRITEEQVNNLKEIIGMKEGPAWYAMDT